jgi:3-hydroxybutyryl-CoA dehydratase
MNQIENIFIGQIIRVQKTFTEEDVCKWSQLTKDDNQVYQEGIYYDSPIVPGILCDGLITEAISKEFASKICCLVKKELLYLTPIHLGEKITAEVETIAVNHEMNWITEKVTCLNSTGKEVVIGQVILKIIEAQNRRRNHNGTK